MMKPTTDRQVALSRTATAFGREVDLLDTTSKLGGFVLEGNGGIAMFIPVGSKRLRVTLGFDPDSRGKNAIDSLNEAYAWVFENTDTEVLEGYIDTNAKHSMGIVPHLIGGLIERIDGETAVGTITRERWLEARRAKA